MVRLTEHRYGLSVNMGDESLQETQNMHRLNKEYGTGRTGQSRRLFRQIFLPDPVAADAETVASLDDLLGKLVQIFPAEVGVAEVTVEIGHREHHPVAVLRAVGQVVGHQGGQDIGRHFLRAHLLKPLCQFRRQLRLRTAQGAQLQGVGDHIVKADRPRALCQGGQALRLVLKHFAAPFMVKQLVQLPGGSCVVLMHQARVCQSKLHGPVKVAAEPAPALLVHQLGKLLVERRETGAVLPLLTGCTAALGNTAPGAQAVVSKTDLLPRIAGQQRAVQSVK